MTLSIFIRNGREYNLSFLLDFWWVGGWIESNDGISVMEGLFCDSNIEEWSTFWLRRTLAFVGRLLRTLMMTVTVRSVSMISRLSCRDWICILRSFSCASWYPSWTMITRELFSSNRFWRSIRERDSRRFMGKMTRLLWMPILPLGGLRTGRATSMGRCWWG